ncbi:MAG: hypothetical protein U9P38_00475, partial [Campylobacterota bacterium]|nr:hypothetical protein [Campylobacterota bacterium]
MAGVIGKVVSIDGKFFAKDQDGTVRELFEGDKVYEGETVIGDVDNEGIDNIIVNLEDGSNLVVSGDQSQLFDAFLSKKEFTEDETVNDSDSIDSIVSENFDINNVETASGEEQNIGSSEINIGEFDQHQDNKNKDISAETRDVEVKHNTSEIEDTSKYNLEFPDRTNLTDAINSLNSAINSLEESITDAKELQEIAERNPTQNNIEGMQNSVTELSEAKKDLITFIDNLKSEIISIQEEAALLNITVDVNEAQAIVSQADTLQQTTDIFIHEIEITVDELNELLTNRREESENTTDENDSLEATSDNSVGDLETAANTAAVSANTAVESAESAAQTLSAN